MVWGGRRFERFLGKNLKAGVSYGESWEVGDHPMHRSQLTIATGYGVTLEQLMKDEKPELLGPAANKHAMFPWLIKLLDANDWLSVQVHPDETAVKKLLPGEGSKTEAWLVLDAAPTSLIYAGLKPGVGEKELRQALDQGKVADCLHAFTPKPGDFVYLPAGVVHAVGGGVLLAEIQQTSDATFRLFDWNRKDAKGNSRQLHIEESFASIHWNQGPIELISVGASEQRLVSCPYFDIDWMRQTATFQLGGTGRMQAWIVSEGRGRFANGEFVMPGDAWILPAAMPAMTVTPDAPFAGLLCSLP